MYFLQGDAKIAWRYVYLMHLRQLKGPGQKRTPPQLLEEGILERSCQCQVLGRLNGNKEM